MSSILYGNGLNLLNEGTPSWDDLLKDIAKERLDTSIPNTLKYEAVILKQPYREKPLRLQSIDGDYLFTKEGKRLFTSGEVIELLLKKDIAERVKLFEPNEVYDLVSELPVKHFMTTNYDNTLIKQRGKDAVKVRFRQEQIYSIRRHYTLEGNQQYWPIHGNMDSPRSIMLGFDHYCGALSKVESYVKGGYEMPEVGRITSVTKRLEEGVNEIHSWIDLFFCSDVHIIGLGLDYAEMDLWWILNKRRRIKQKYEGVIKNRIIYYPVEDIAEDKRQLLNGFDVEICGLGKYSKNEYKRIYKEQLQNMKNRMI